MAQNELKKEKKVKQSLRYSILEGSYYSAMVGFGESFFTAFAVFLKATNLQIGLIGSLPQALGAALQLFSNRLIHIFGSRKRLVCALALLQGLMYIPVMLTFYFGKFSIFYLILFISLYFIFGSIINPAWSSWMGDLVDERKRGAYFGLRNKISGMVSFVSFVIAGFMLQRFSDSTITQYAGFAVLFVIAFISRIFSFVYLLKKYEPPYRVVKGAEFGFVEFLQKARFTNYGMFVIFYCCMNLAVYIAAPFFTVYMLKDLNFSYLTFTLISAIAIIAKYLTMPAWGKACDRFGTRKVLTLSGFLMPAVPFLWTLSTDIWYLVLVQVFSGLVWAGFDLSSFNFIFDTTSNEKRATCVAYYNVLNGAAVFTGAMLGAAIIKYIPLDNILWSSYYLVFIASFGLRYVASFIFIPKLKEARQVQTISYKNLFLNVISAAPTMGLLHHMIMFRHKK